MLSFRPSRLEYNVSALDISKVMQALATRIPEMPTLVFGERKKIADTRYLRLLCVRLDRPAEC